jgi:NADPH-dependent glutamate synthase beta subunit-like oxidoreductase
MARRNIADSVSRSETTVSPINTGLWRKIAPLYQTKKSPCTHFCPCAENIPVWMDLVRKRKFEDAWRILTGENPFPLVCGRVCYRFCEKECNRKGIDDRVSINAVERFLGEYGVAHHLRPAVSAEKHLKEVRVAIIGGGPAGLSAAHFLAKERCSVTIYDAHKELGGLLRYGIPQYRLPKQLLELELQNMIYALGVKTKMRCRVDERLFNKLLLENDYVLVALGADKSKKMPGIDGQGSVVIAGLKLLSLVANGEITQFPGSTEHVCVIGGGNAAIDVARTSLRLGAKQVTIIYRRTENEMPAHKDEIEAAKKEGVEFSFLTLPRLVHTENAQNVRLSCVRMKLGDADTSGRQKPVEVPNSDFDIACNMVVYAIGEETDMAPVAAKRYRAETEDDICGDKVIFVGDALYGPRSVSEAIASGKKAAQKIIGVFANRTKVPDTREIVGEADIKFVYLNERRKDPKILHEKALTREQFMRFAETTATITEDMAAIEADRCINCGNCIGCDRCLNFCPDYCITKGKDGIYTVDPDFCKGCGLCSDVCERGVINTKKEGGDGHE